MNDEDFARSAFAHALESGFAGEPGTLPSLDRIVARARQATRARQGFYAAGTVALAGVVTVGVVAGPTLIGLGGGSPDVSSAGQAGGTGSTGSPGGGKAATASTSVPDTTKPSPGVPCSDPPQIDWAAIVTAHLAPGTQVAPLHDPSCVEQPGGPETIEAELSLTNPDGIVQINVNKGLVSKSPDPNASASGSASKAGVPDLLRKLDALKRAGATSTDGSTTSGPATSPSTTKVAEHPQCSDVAPGETACVSEVSKGGYNGVDVQLFRTTSPELLVDVVGSGPKPSATDPSPKAPLDAAPLIAIAEAVATHF